METKNEVLKKVWVKPELQIEMIEDTEVKFASTKEMVSTRS